MAKGSLNGSSDMLAEAMRKVFRETIAPLEEKIDDNGKKIDSFAAGFNKLERTVADQGEKIRALTDKVATGTR